MVRADALRLQAALDALFARAVQNPRVATEVQGARREFTSAAAPPVAARQQVEARFREWFLLERESLTLGATPAEALGLEGDARGLGGSTVGVFTISRSAGGSAEARDLQAKETCELRAPAGALERGDLMVGRIYPLPDGCWQPSAAIAVYRPGKALAAAFERDLARLALDRRLSQQELERLLLSRMAPDAAAARPIEHLEAELEQLLHACGAPANATAISAALAAAERQGPVIGPLLDQLAFDTEVDLDRARRLLHELWNAHHRGAAKTRAEGPEPEGPAPGAEGAPPGETLGERLVRTLDAGLARRRDVDELFAELEAMAGIEPGEEEEGEGAEEGARGAAAAPLEGDFGDLAPLVAEYLWETGRSGTPAAATLDLWVRLQRNAAVPHTDLEQITGQDLMRVLLHVYLAAEPGARARGVRAAFDTLQEFSSWAQSTQELSLSAPLQDCRGILLDHLERLQAAGVALSGGRGDAGRREPALLRVDEVQPHGFGVRTDAGTSHWIAAPKATTDLLRAGDLLLGALAQGDGGERLVGLVVALPGDAEALIG